MGGVEDREEPQAYDGPVRRELVPQYAYKSARQQKELSGLRTIKFSVYGMEGIRLSDALEENWAGLEGRDDRPLIEDGRVQVMVRLHVRPQAIVRT